MSRTIIRLYTSSKVYVKGYEAWYIPSIEITVFTGEELTLKLLKEGIKYATDSGFIVRLVTNAWWASSREKALTFLKELGLKELNVSYDDFHSAFIQGRNIVNTVKAALRPRVKSCCGYNSS